MAPISTIRARVDEDERTATPPIGGAAVAPTPDLSPAVTAPVATAAKSGVAAAESGVAAAESGVAAAESGVHEAIPGERAPSPSEPARDEQAATAESPGDAPAPEAPPLAATGAPEATPPATANGHLAATEALRTDTFALTPAAGDPLIVVETGAPAVDAEAATDPAPEQPTAPTAASAPLPFAEAVPSYTEEAPSYAWAAPGSAVPTLPRPTVALPADDVRRRPVLSLRLDARRRAGLRRAGIRTAIAAAALVLLMSLGLLSLRSAYGDRIYPAVYVAGLDLGGLTRDEARVLLTERAASVQQGLVTFTYEGHTWSPTLAELGATVDVEATLDAAYRVGRESTAQDRLLATGLLLHDDRQVPLVLRMDYAVLNGWFDQVATELGMFPHDAYLVIEGSAVRIEPEVSGTSIDRERGRMVVEAALAGLEPVNLDLPMTTWIARVQAADLEPARAMIEQALSQPVEVTFNGRSWTIQPDDVAPFIVQRTNPDPTVSGAAAVIVEFDEGGLASWLDGLLAAEVNQAPVNAEVGWNGERVIALSASVDGIRLRPRSLARALAASFLGDHAPVEMPVSVVVPPVREDNLDALGITTQLARGDSYYAGGNWERRHNVEVGTSLLNGTLVPPGEEFSFNHAIGEITADKGYVESSVVVAERVGRDIGGGICQVSTTVFRAALLAGLPITEWWPHTYEILQYEAEGWGPGFDASILQPEGDPFGGGDFRFLNPTDSWLLVEAWTTGVNVIVNIYGPDLGWDVQFSETTKSEPIIEGEDLEIVDYDLPPGTIIQTEFPLVGFEVSFIRYVYDANGNLIEEREFYTRFRGRGTVYNVSPDMQGMSPAG